MNLSYNIKGKIKAVNQNLIFNFTSNQHISELKDHEKKLFVNEDFSNFIVQYKEDNDDNTNSTRKYSFPFSQNLQYNNLFSLFQNQDYTLLRNFKYCDNIFYIKKWVFQIISAILVIHERKEEPYIGTLSDECFVINNLLDLKLGFLSNLPAGSSLIPNCYYFYEPNRFEKSLPWDISPDEVYQSYDIFALGILLRQISSLKKYELVNNKYTELKKRSRYYGNDNENNDNKDNDTHNNDNDNINDFTKIITEIINSCLKEVRPDITSIKEMYDRYYTNHNLNQVNTKDQNDIYKELTDYNDLINSFEIDQNSKKPNFFKLSSSFIFGVNYDKTQDSFVTIPIGNDVTEETSKKYEEYLNKKYMNNFLFDHFFSNLYFCNLFDLLKCYIPSENEILYWIYCLFDFIKKMNDESFNLPLNFTIENVFVSFYATSDSTNNQAQPKDFQIQLSIFPFDSNEKLNSEFYVNDAYKNDKDRSDIYSFAILALELLYKYIDDEFFFNCEEIKKIKKSKEGTDTTKDQINIFINTFLQIKIDNLKNLFKDGFYHSLIDIISECLFEETNFNKINKKINDLFKPDVDESSKNSISIKSYIEKRGKEPSKMDFSRFASLFLSYQTIESKNLLLIFNNTMFNLCKINAEDFLTFDISHIYDYIMEELTKIKSQTKNEEEEETETEADASYENEEEETETEADASYENEEEEKEAEADASYENEEEEETEADASYENVQHCVLDFEDYKSQRLQDFWATNCDVKRTFKNLRKQDALDELNCILTDFDPLKSYLILYNNDIELDDLVSLDDILENLNVIFNIENLNVFLFVDDLEHITITNIPY